jgi:hypothetical protein
LTGTIAPSLLGRHVYRVPPGPVTRLKAVH